jgi:hypothetical protein
MLEVPSNQGKENGLKEKELSGPTMKVPITKRKMPKSDTSFVVF